MALVYGFRGGSTMLDSEYFPAIKLLLDKYNGQSVIPYLYFRKDRQLAGCVIRINKPDGKEIRQHTYHKENGQWLNKALPEPRPLFNCLELLDNPDKPVLIVEGEKAAAAAMRMPEFKNFVVVTWSGGANAAHKADWSMLDGREKIIIWPDNDEAGIRAAQVIANILYERNSK